MPWLGDLKSNVSQMETKAATWTSGGIVRQPQIGYNKDWDIQRAVNDALTKVTWVYRCVQAIASNAARVPMVVRNDNPYDGVPVVNHPLYYVLNSKANPGESSFIFRYRLSAQILLSNKGAFVEVVRNRGKNVSRLDLIPPDLVTVVPDPKNFVKEFVVTIPSGNGSAPRLRHLKPEDVIWIRNPHPFDAYKSLTPLDALGLAIETDYYAKVYNRNFLLNDGRPGGMVVIKGDASEETKEELQARFRGNLMMAGRISVITSAGGADFVDTAVNPRDAQYTEVRGLTKQEILLGFGVPETVLANASSKTFDNAEAERVVFWTETMANHLELVTREFDVLEPDDNKYMGVDLDRVDVLQRQDMKRKEFCMREKDAGLISTDEYREQTGKKDTGTEQGKVLFRANTAIPFTTTDGKPLPQDTHGVQNAPLPSAEEQARLQAEQQERISQGGQDGPGQPADTTVKPQADEEPPERNDPRPKPLANAPKKSIDIDLLKEEVSNDFERWTIIASSAVDRMVARQKRVVGEKINSHKTRRMLQKRSRIIESGPVSGPGSEVSLKAAVDSVFDQQMWNRQITEDLEPVLRGVYREFSKAMAEESDEMTEVASFVISNELKTICEVNTFVKDSIEEGFAALAIRDDVETLPSDIILDFYEDSVSDKIRSVVKRAVVAVANGAIWDSSAHVGGELKSWVSLNGSAGPDVKTIPIEEPFEVGGSSARYPGDPQDPERRSHGLAILLIDDPQIDRS